MPSPRAFHWPLALVLPAGRSKVSEWNSAPIMIIDWNDTEYEQLWMHPNSSCFWNMLFGLSWTCRLAQSFAPLKWSQSLLGTHPQKNICQGIPRDFVFCYSWFFHSEWFQVYVNHCKSLNHDDGFWAVLNMNGKGLSWFFHCLSNHTGNMFAVSINIIWLVVSIPLKNISSLVGMMKFPLNVVKLNK